MNASTRNAVAAAIATAEFTMTRVSKSGRDVYEAKTIQLADGSTAYVQIYAPAQKAAPVAPVVQPAAPTVRKTRAKAAAAAPVVTVPAVAQVTPTPGMDVSAMVQAMMAQMLPQVIAQVTAAVRK